MLEPVADGSALARAFLRVGGASLARHQLAVAMAMDCQRVICVARELHSQLIALQHEAEAAGARFHVVRDSRALSALVTANDELLVQADGLFATVDEALDLLGGGPVILAQPVEVGLASGYERIDINRATAGLMRIPGRLAERLAELPDDCDPVSALTRIALQAGVDVRELPAELRNGPNWRLIRSEAEAQEHEDALVRSRLASAFVPTPGRYIARAGVLAHGSALLHSGGGSRFARIAAVVALVLGLGSGWLGLLALGLLFSALAAVFHHAACLLKRVEQSLESPRNAPGFLREELVGWAIDLELVVLMAWDRLSQPWLSPLDAAFAPVMLVLLTRVIPGMVDMRWGRWVEDRAVLGFTLAMAAALGVLAPAAQVAALLLTAAGLALQTGRFRITSA